MYEHSDISPGLKARVALEKHGFKHTHSLGQNFLLDDDAAARLAELADASPGDAILEIGAGAGVMTSHLAASGARVLALEIDESLRQVLDEVLDGYERISLVFKDALKADLPREAGSVFGPVSALKVVANLPYYITTEIIEKLIAMEAVNDMYLMVQREAAERIMSAPGQKKYCALAARVSLYGRSEILMTLPPTAFTPSPHVESCFIHIARHTDPPATPDNPAIMNRLISAAFAMRRKTMANNLRAAFGADKGRAEGWLDRAGIDKNARGEALSLVELARLSDVISQSG